MISTTTDPRDVCVYCLDTGVMGPDQVLLRGETCYISAPRGQLIEGYVVVAPYACVGAMALVDERTSAEVARFRDVVGDFFREAYGVEAPIFYEQGRGGGGMRCDPTKRFPYHAHLCGLPVTIDAHSAMTERFTRAPVTTLRALGRVVAGVPYAYVDGVDHDRDIRRAAYLPGSPHDTRELEGLRFKPILAELLGLADRADWRVYPGDAARQRVVEKFSRFVRERGAKSG